MASPFFHAPATPSSESLAILHLKRDNLQPLKLRAGADDGYAEGAVVNTRFGSFPHSTLIGVQWGSQVRASRVDTGTRGRKGKAQQEQAQPAGEDSNTVRDAQAADDQTSRKRKSEEKTLGNGDVVSKKAKTTEPARDTPRGAQKITAPVGAESGFIHVLQPTPETWTASLDHRTQVVYTPDYSYVLQRLRARPGDALIEAGAGSGSFTHAAARAIFNGYSKTSLSSPTSERTRGQVYSYEFHEPRVQTLRDELHDHGLDSVVTLNHRDVCAAGFGLPGQAAPNVTAIFLDLPAPWLALPHLTRTGPHTPLHPSRPIHICTFSPCIEQVMTTVSALRRAGWVEIAMVEVQNRRMDVRRERIGLKEEGLRGVNAAAANVEEAVARLREVDAKLSAYHRNGGKEVVPTTQEPAGAPKGSSKQQRHDQNKRNAEERKLYKEGRVVHRTEPEVKTHTSYLVFAVLPRTWTEEDEARCVAKGQAGRAQ